MGISVVFTGAIVSIGERRIMRCKFFEPYVVIIMQPRFIIVDEHLSGDMHRVHQTKAFSHTALLNELLDFRCDVDEPAPVRHFEPKMFRE